MTFSVALPQRRLEDVERELLSVSDPAHTRYGRWHTLAEVSAMTAAHTSSRSRVRRWLEAANATCTDTPGSLRCSSTALAVMDLFQARVHAYRDGHSGRVLHRVPPSSSFVVPQHVAPHIDFLTRLYDFPSARRDGVERGLSTRFAVAVETIQRLYGLTGVTSSAASSVGPVQFVNNPAVTE